MSDVFVQVQGSATADSTSQQGKEKAQERPKSARQRERGEIEENPMKHQLNTYIKRVAELETRVEELTIRAEVLLSHMCLFGGAVYEHLCSDCLLTLGVHAQ